MKSPTSHYKKLKADLRKARKIVVRVDPIECKNDLQRLKLSSYVLLCHAAIEQFLEELALEAAMDARRNFKDKGRISRTLVALVAAKVLDETKAEKSKSKIGSDLVRDIDEYSKQAINLFRNTIKENHGISERNLDNLFIPIGFKPNEIDLSLVNSLTALGERRGGLAHKFVIKNEDTLSAFETDLKSIVRDLEGIDQEVCLCSKYSTKIN
ncbi:hypothetical protein GCM10009096_07120 [Parasphingorhabdus litoris]|uniref:RiboL-PSP-HEPN domain-containing protein n=1 Tax=Parasphingorhabdus litoris TaxID=394733 RepID=A0ABN1A6J0_9SPHN|nr:HEPN domain-containing protein [Parasphingorhabdus litoris]